MTTTRIDLPLGWYLEVPLEPDEDGRQQGFVFSPDGKESASLSAAIELGTTTGDDEREIPEWVRSFLPQYEEQYG